MRIVSRMPENEEIFFLKSKSVPFLLSMLSLVIREWVRLRLFFQGADRDRKLHAGTKNKVMPVTTKWNLRKIKHITDVLLCGNIIWEIGLPSFLTRILVRICKKYFHVTLQGRMYNLQRFHQVLLTLV